MQIKVQKLPKAKIEIVFEFPWPEFEGYYNKALENFNKGIVLNGFRQGKAPKDLIEQRIGSEKILEEAVELSLQENYPQVINKENLEVISQAQVEVLKLAKGNDCVCRVKAEVLPEVNLPNCRKIARETKKQEVKVEEKEVQDALDWLRKSRADFEDLARPSQKGDFVEISYQSPQIEDNKQFEDRFFLGQGRFIPGFEDNLEGMKPDQEKEFSLVFPQDYFKKELAGKPIDFRLKMKKAQRAILQDLDDEFARSVGKFESLADLQKNVQEGIAKEKREAEKQRWREQVLAQIAGRTEMEIPDILLEKEKNRLSEEMKREAQEHLGISFDDYLKEKFGAQDVFERELEKQALNSIKRFLILRAIGRKEGVEVKEEEVNDSVKDFSRKFSNLKDVENQIDSERLRSYHRGILWNEKVFEIMEGFAK